MKEQPLCCYERQTTGKRSARCGITLAIPLRSFRATSSVRTSPEPCVLPCASSLAKFHASLSRVFAAMYGPNIKASPQKTSFRDRFQKLIRVVAFGNLFPTLSAEDWKRWSASVAAGCAQYRAECPQHSPLPNEPPYRLGANSARRLLHWLRTRPDAGRQDCQNRRRTGNRGVIGRTKRRMATAFRSGRAAPAGANSSLRRLSRGAVRLSPYCRPGSGGRL